MRDVSADGPSRRDFLKSAGGGVVGAMLGGPAGGGLALPTDDELAPMAALPQEVTRPWLGPPYWSNRLQDWRLHQGRIECLTGAESHEVRSVGVLTRSIAAGRQPGHLSVKTGLIEGQQGFCGFPVGVGEGDESALDYRAAALAQRGSGTGGGFLCTFEMDGRALPRAHRREQPARLRRAALREARGRGRGPPADSGPARPPPAGRAAAIQREGYGLVRLDKDEQAYVLECWPWHEDPDAGGQQFEGWPYRLPFDKADGRNA